MILLDNAVKYTPKSGDINITLTHESSDAVLTVRNTGVGISEDAQNKYLNVSIVRTSQEQEKAAVTGLVLQ